MLPIYPLPKLALTTTGSTDNRLTAVGHLSLKTGLSKLLLFVACKMSAVFTTEFVLESQHILAAALLLTV